MSNSFDERTVNKWESLKEDATIGINYGLEFISSGVYASVSAELTKKELSGDKDILANELSLICFENFKKSVEEKANEKKSKNERWAFKHSYNLSNLYFVKGIKKALESKEKELREYNQKVLDVVKKRKNTSFLI